MPSEYLYRATIFFNKEKTTSIFLAIYLDEFLDELEINFLPIGYKPGFIIINLPNLTPVYEEYLYIIKYSKKELTEGFLYYLLYLE